MKNLFLIALAMIVMLNISQIKNEEITKLRRKENARKSESKSASLLPSLKGLAKELIGGAGKVLNKVLGKKEEAPKDNKATGAVPPEGQALVLRDPSVKSPLKISGTRFTYKKLIPLSERVVGPKRAKIVSNKALSKSKNRIYLDTLRIPSNLNTVNIRVGLNKVGLMRKSSNSIDLGYKYILRLNGKEIENFGGTGTMYEDIDFRWLQSGLPSLAKGKHILELDVLLDAKETDEIYFKVENQNNAIVQVDGFY